MAGNTNTGGKTTTKRQGSGMRRASNHTASTTSLINQDPFVPLISLDNNNLPQGTPIPSLLQPSIIPMAEGMAELAPSIAINRPSTSLVTKNVPAFLSKLFAMVNDPSTDMFIRWNQDGTSFVVERQEDFAREVLPKFFKHNNAASFVRQLNMYGFHKVPHLQQGSLHGGGIELESWEFTNPHFQRNHPDLIALVTRKRGRETSATASSAAFGFVSSIQGNHGIGLSHSNAASEESRASSSSASIPPAAPQVEVNHIIQEIAAIKRHQITISTDLKNIQQENHTLWLESIALRERYAKQEQTIDKIVSFLASVFSQGKMKLETDGVASANGSAGSGSRKRRKHENLRLEELEEPQLGPADHADSDEDGNETDWSADPAIQQKVFEILKSPMSAAQSNGGSSSLPFLPGNSPGQLLAAIQSSNDSAHSLSQSTANLNSAIIRANKVAEDIDLLQDHLHGVSSLMNLPQTDDGAVFMGDLNVSAPAPYPQFTGCEEDRATLMALIKQHPELMYSYGFPNPSAAIEMPPSQNGSFLPQFAFPQQRANSSYSIASEPLDLMKSPFDQSMPATSSSSLQELFPGTEAELSPNFMEQFLVNQENVDDITHQLPSASLNAIPPTASEPSCEDLEELFPSS